MTTSCLFESCDRAPKAKGLCGPHYGQKRAGKQLKPLRKMPPRGKAPQRTCAVDLCDRPSKANGLCLVHYKHQRAGRPLGPIQERPTPIRKEVVVAFIRDSIATGDPAACWTEWPFPSFKSDDRPRAGKSYASHVALELHGFPRPPAPRNLALHSCHNGKCWNPHHLRWGTQAENVADMHSADRSAIQRYVGLIRWLDSNGIEFPSEYRPGGSSRHV